MKAFFFYWEDSILLGGVWRSFDVEFIHKKIIRIIINMRELL
jgi:hypothetical protein